MTHQTRLLCAAAMVLFAATPLFAFSEGGEAGTWWPTLAKFVNFALLVWFIKYVAAKFELGPYLRERSSTIRKDLVDAASLRANAQQQLAGVEQRLARLPGELQELERRGAEELAAEKVRQAEATKQEHDRVLEHTRREIELQLRLARRELVEHSASVSMMLARKRLEKDITPDDQQRLIDRYATEVRA